MDVARIYNADVARRPVRDRKDGVHMKLPIREDRYLGCLLGLAVGDALGTTLEFTSPGSFDPIDDMVGGGPFGLKPLGYARDVRLLDTPDEDCELEISSVSQVDQAKPHIMESFRVASTPDLGKA